MTDDEKRRLIGEFFDKVAHMNPCEAVRLLEYFRSERWEEHKRQVLRVKKDRSKDPAVTPPGMTSVFARVAGR